jgi:hypothetical protein
MILYRAAFLIFGLAFGGVLLYFGFKALGGAALFGGCGFISCSLL